MEINVFLFFFLGLSWVMLEFGNAFGFLIGPLLVPNPPRQNGTEINTAVTIDDTEFDAFSGDRIDMRYDMMKLMYFRKYQ